VEPPDSSGDWQEGQMPQYRKLAKKQILYRFDLGRKGEANSDLRSVSSRVGRNLFNQHKGEKAG